MTPDELAEWMAIAMQLRSASPERFDEIRKTLRETAAACALIADHDHELVLRARRPTKRYSA